MIFFTLAWAKKESSFVIASSFIICLHFFFAFYTPLPKSAPILKKRIEIHTTNAAKQVRHQQHTKSQIHSHQNGKTIDQKKRALKEMTESFAKLEKIQQELPKIDTLPTPTLITLTKDKGKEEHRGYAAKLSAFLKEKLELPEKGAVQLTVTILSSGLIKKLKILATESKKNQHYVEMRLPLLQCPPFVEGEAEGYETTFTITFCNESH